MEEDEIGVCRVLNWEEKAERNASACP